MSSNGSGATWLSLLDEKKQDVKKSFGQGYIALRNINSGRSFRSALETFCRSRHEYKLEHRLDATILPSFTAITELVRAVDQSTADLQRLSPSDTLEGLIWWISFNVIKVRNPARRLYLTDPSSARVSSGCSAHTARDSDR